MKLLISHLILLALALGASAAPLRVFIRAGIKTHGPNAHEHERFLNDWKPLLSQRGITTEGAKDWPSAQQLQATDVLVMYAQDGGNATAEQKENLAEFTRRGGGIVVIHTAVVSDDPTWWKSVIGGAWIPQQTLWKEGPINLNYVKATPALAPHPITRGAADWHLDDEIYFNLDLSPDCRVLATSVTPRDRSHQAQMWIYEKDPYRAFVCIPGHLYDTFEKPFFRAILLRGIAWAGKRPDADEFCTPLELTSLATPAASAAQP
jgi:type 1 glutamine amidotransferase